MTAIKIKAASKSTNAPPADEAAPKSPTAPISSGDDAAPPASSNANDHDNDSSIDDSSNGETFSGNEEAVVDGEVLAASVKGGGGEEEDANHDSNDAAGEERNVEATVTDNAKEEKEEGNDDVKEEDSPHDTEDAHVANATSGNEGQDEDAIDAEEKEEDGNEGEEDCPNVACSMYQSTHDKNCTNAYFSCLDCQQNNYGGWPEDKSEKQHRETIVIPDLPTSRNGEEEEKSDDEDAGEGEEKWDLIEFIAVKDLKKKKPKKCQEEGCTSAACSVWASNLAPDDEWYGCIDCMENYYEGWPSSAEMPVKHLTEEHRALLHEKCSERENPPMPDLPTTMPLLATDGGNVAANMTPLPSHEQAVADNQSNLVVGAFRSKGKKSGVRHPTIFRSLSRALFLIKVIVTLTLLFKVCELHSPLPSLEWTSSLSKPCEIQPSSHTPRYLRHDVLPARATPPPEEDNTSIDIDGPSETPLGVQGSLLLPDLLDGLDPFSIGSFNYALAEWSETFPMPSHHDSFEDPIRNSDIIDSVDKRLELYDNDLIVNRFDESSIQREVVDFDVRRRGTDHDSIFRLESEMVGNEQVNFAESEMVGNEQVNFAEPDESFEDPIRNSDTNVIVNVLSDVSNVVDHPAKRQKIATPTVSPTSICQSKDYLQHRDPSVLVIDDSIPMAYSGNAAYTALYNQAGDDMRAIVADHSPPYMYNPESHVVPIDVMHSVCNDLSLCNGITDWRNLQTSTETVIYAHVDNASNKVRYVGYTSNYTQRHESHLAEKGPIYFLDHTTVRLVSYDNIPSSVDRPLSDRLIRLWTDITQLINLPPNLTRLYTNILDSWYRGGPKKQYSAQTIEIGEQRYYEIPTIMAEAFMYDEVKETRLTGYAAQAGEALVAVIDNAWGKEISIASDQPFGISSWRTGAKAGTLSSCIEATEYMLGNDNWKDTFPHPIYPNAETEAEIFTAPSSPEHIALGQSNFREYLRPYAQNSKKYSITLADAQNYAWKSLVEPQMELCELGFEHVDTLLGGEIIAFQKDNALVFLHGHLALACDSREEIAIVDRQRRAVSVDALRIARQRAVGDNSPRRFDAIVGSLYAEISDVGWHGSRRFGAAICRDTMSSKDAIEAFGGPTQAGLTPANDINYPTSNAARYRESGESLTMQRFTDAISQRGIEAAVRSYHSYLEDNNWAIDRQGRVDLIIQFTYIPPSYFGSNPRNCRTL